jgi:sec-independent protein translocase protein TatA
VSERRANVFFQEIIMTMPGWLEIVIVLVIVLILFGPGRIGRLASELGKGLHNFRKGVNGDVEEEKNRDKTE